MASLDGRPAGAAAGLHGLMEEVEQRLHLHLLVYEAGGADGESAHVVQAVGDGLREILVTTELGTRKRETTCK